jgi:hypothetical protein
MMEQYSQKHKSNKKNAGYKRLAELFAAILPSVPTVECLCFVLGPLCDFTKQVQSGSVPTSSIVIPFYRLLRDELEQLVDKQQKVLPTEVKAMAQRILTGLQGRLGNADDFPHEIVCALTLDPRFKSHQRLTYVFLKFSLLTRSPSNFFFFSSW